MSRGLLSDYFAGVAVKKLAAVDADPDASNQHEVTGSAPLQRILGSEDRHLKGGTDNRFPATYIWLGEEQEGITEDGKLSWYDSRRQQPHRSAEWRLYYQANAVTKVIRPGDTLFLARTQDDRLLFIVAAVGSTSESQIAWLFDLPPQDGLAFVPREISRSTDAVLDFAARYILDEIGIEPESETDQLDQYLVDFQMRFPKTRELSDLARASLGDLPVRDAPDEVLVKWMEREELLFRRIERKIVAERLQEGFLLEGEADVDGFISFSLSVQNRRKSRTGYALENHLEALLDAHEIKYQRQVVTENGNKPDFLFPDQSSYRDPFFPHSRLTMLGAKSTLKERWRQVLSEAERIDTKHLLTLEPSISKKQTDEMISKNLQLIVPAPLHKTYKADQTSWLMTVSGFIDLVRKRQAAG